ncbi:ribosome maturation factor RimM [soil metagenome]
MTDRPGLVLLGVVTAAHGIKGEVKLRSFTADPKAVASYGPLVSKSGETIEIERLRPEKDGFIAVLKGVRDRTRAETLRGTELFVPRGRLPAVKEGEIYVHDLVGLDAVLGDGTVLGEMIGTRNFGAGELLEIRRAGASDTVFVPMTPDFIAAIDIAERRILLDLPDGYLDEGEPDL